MFTYIRNVYYLSFPVVIGAVLSNRMATRLSGVDPIDWPTPTVLGLVVFIVYTVDRLLDVRKYDFGVSGQPLSARHRFHRQYESLLWKFVIGAAVLAFVLTFFLPNMPSSVVKFGIVLGGVCVAYVGGVFRLPANHSALLLKEPFVAVLYTAGVWGSVWVQRPAISYVDITEGLMFLGIAFQNLLLFAVMEQQEAELPVMSTSPSKQANRPGQPMFSLATEWGENTCDVVLRWLTFVVIAAGFTLCFLTKDRFAQRSALMLALMSLVLYSIQRYPAYFLKHERYRWLGDGVFWMPALVL